MKDLSKNLISLLLIFLITVPATAFADEAAAQVFYENAAKEYGKGNYEKAAELLYKAYVNDANLIYAYNRILALQADKQYTAALKELNVFENQMMNDADKRFEDVPQIKSKLEEQVKAAANANVKDPVKKDPIIKDPDVKDPEVKDPDNNVQPIPESGMNPNEVLGVTIAGAGLIPLGVGILFTTGLFTSDEFKDSSKEGANRQKIYEDAYNGGVKCFAPPQGLCNTVQDKIKEDQEDADQDLLIGIILIGAGSALIIGGGITYLLSGDTPDEEGVTFSPYITSTGAGAGFSLDF